MEKEKEVKEQDSQTPKASRSGAAAEGSQSHPHPVAEGRQSPGLAALLAEAEKVDTADIVDDYKRGFAVGRVAGLSEAAEILAASVPAGLEEAAFQAWWSKEVEKDEEFPSRYSAAIAAWMERAALAAPGAPQGPNWTAPCGCVVDLSYWYCPTHQSADADRAPSQEEGPAGVDLDAVGKAVRWMGWWIGSQDCDCEDGHRCGLPERAKECAEAVEALARLRAKAPASSPRPDLSTHPCHGEAARIYSALPPSGLPVEETPIANRVALKLFSYAYGLETEIGRLRASSPRDLEAAEVDRVVSDAEYHAEILETTGSALNGQTFIATSPNTYLETAKHMRALLSLVRAHPPKGETPSEAAGVCTHSEPSGLDKPFETRHTFEADPVSKHIFSPKCRLCGLTIGEIVRAGRPGTPIEKAAREYVEAETAFHVAMDSRDPDHEIRAADAKMNAAYDRLVASLSSLPQEHTPNQSQPEKE